MQRDFLQIIHKLDGYFTKSEISVLRRLILEQLRYDSTGFGLTDKIKHLSDSELRKIEDIVHRLLAGEPIQYILGKTEFYGLPFFVAPQVLIPRPETEELVEWILEENRQPGLFLLDIGTGSGCIAVTLAKKLQAASVYACDISESALDLASRNAALNGVRLNLFRQNIFEDFVVDRLFDLWVSNPPYVTEAEKEQMDFNVIGFEPHEALFVPDDDALVFYERIATLSRQFLKIGGKLYFEINRDKGHALTTLLTDMGFTSVRLRKDISGNDRMVCAMNA